MIPMAIDSGSARIRLMAASSAMPRWYWAATLGLALTACSPPEPPVENSAPTRLVRIHGNASPSLTIKVSTQYLSTSRDCRRKQSRVTAPMSTWVESDVTRTGTTYEASVSLDHFAEDECRWQPFVIGFQVMNQAGLSTGRFSTGEKGTELVPGPENKVWISTPGQQNSPDGHRAGSAFIRPLDLKCTVNALRGTKSLSCVPNTPRELPLLSEQATEVQVDFEDLTKP
jgi:hypothetical protein